MARNITDAVFRCDYCSRKLKLNKAATGEHADQYFIACHNQVHPAKFWHFFPLGQRPPPAIAAHLTALAALQATPNAALSTPSPTTCLHMPCNKMKISKLCDRQMCKQHCDGRGGCRYHPQQPKQLLPPLTGGSLTLFEDIALYARPPTLTAYVSKEQRDREATRPYHGPPRPHSIISLTVSINLSQRRF
ncbi:hypothetical protein C8R44DRAFT_858499 [Mycena epipterygia]|nr:hypothetical protein C8R44DRAFT_858499 [Mycena epipterygia]